MSTKIHYIVASLILTFHSACPDNSETTDSTDDTGVSETGTAPSTGAETGETPTTGGDTANTTDDASTGSAGTTTQDGETGDDAGDAGDVGEETGATGETGDTGEVETLPGCVTLCELGVMCGLVPTIDGCVEGCSDAYTSPDPACTAAGEGYLACLVELDCEALNEAMDGDAAECAAEADALSAACEGVDPVCSVGQGGGDGECEVDIECEDAPKLSMACDDTTCSCYVDGEKSGECAADMACSELDQLVEKSKACCDF